MRRLVVALFSLLTACQELLANNLTEESAYHTILFLEEAGIPSQREKAQSGYSIWVPRVDASTARELLQENNLPQIKPSCTPSGLFPSPQEEASARRSCLAFSLAQRLELLDGVLSAQVLLPAASTALWPIEEEPISKVWVFYRYQTKPISEEAIRSLLLSSLGGSPGISITAQPLSVKAKDWAAVGPFAVAPSSARPLTFSLLALLSFGVGASFACLSLWLRQRRLRATPSNRPGA